MFDVGEEVMAIKEYDGNSMIINEIGTIVETYKSGITIFFHRPVGGHNGNLVSKEAVKLVNSLSKEYDVTRKNCWCIQKNKLNDIIIAAKGKNKIRCNLLKKVNC